ncbi:hypothetical protein GKAS_02627 [Kluyvera ascorbata ATCC 33433]|nr:hypothetical protein GKAS_02627 [Kluyvera ascorbata ATCC 33433]
MVQSENNSVNKMAVDKYQHSVLGINTPFGLNGMGIATP